MEEALDLRTAALLLAETVSHQLGTATLLKLKRLFLLPYPPFLFYVPGERELRALSPVAWRLLLARRHDVVYAASQLLMLCGEHTPQAVKTVICGDLYGYTLAVCAVAHSFLTLCLLSLYCVLFVCLCISSTPHSRARGVHRYDALWEERLRVRYGVLILLRFTVLFVCVICDVCFLLSLISRLLFR